MSQKLGILKVRVLEAASAAALETAVNDFLRGAGSPVIAEEKLAQPIQFNQTTAATYQAYIVYTE